MEKYPGVVRIWNDHSSHVFQLYSLCSAVRKIMYTTNAIESVNARFRKVTKKGTFNSENSLFKVLYLGTIELSKKWNEGTILDWSSVLNQLMLNDNYKDIIMKHFNN